MKTPLVTVLNPKHLHLIKEVIFCVLILLIFSSAMGINKNNQVFAGYYYTPDEHYLFNPRDLDIL